MRVVTLSDHAAEQIQKAQAARTATNDRMKAEWQAGVDRREATIADHAGALRQAWIQRRLIAVIVTFFSWLGVRLSSKPNMPPLLTAGADEGRYQGGQEGEGRVVASLSRLFDDQWVAFRGYFNRGGETDLLLVGPTAIVAVEVKYRNGLIHCEGNAWTCDKSDKYGNVVERGLPVRDAKGRSPGAQVNATADGLQAQLARRGHPLAVRRAVILSHDASRIGRVKEPGVEFIGVLADRAFQSQFLALVQPPPGRPDLNVPVLEQIVQQDHDHHARLKAQRSTSVPGTTVAPPAPTVTARAVMAPPIVEPHSPTQLARSRPIKLTPPTSDPSKGPSDLEMRQAKALHEDIVALHRSGGNDEVLDRKVRLAISGHLQNGGRYRVLNLAKPASEDEGARALHQRLIEECRQTVELEDRTLHAIVVPLAVRWHVPDGADWTGVWIDSVDRSDLSMPALMLKHGLGAEKLVFSTRLYEGASLRSLDARLLRQAFMRLEAGDEPDLPELKPMAISPSPAADWQMVYLLAVAVTAADGPLDLDDETRHLLVDSHDMIADAATGAAFEATGTRSAAQAIVEDVWNLAEGVRHGQHLQRRHVLESLLASVPSRVGSPGAALRCWYAEDMGHGRIRLLVDWNATRIEHEFKLNGDAQPLVIFRVALDEAIAARAPAGTATQVQEVNLRDYRKQAQALGMSWLGQAPGKPRADARAVGRPASARPSADPAAGGSRR